MKERGQTSEPGGDDLREEQLKDEKEEVGMDSAGEWPAVQVCPCDGEWLCPNVLRGLIPDCLMCSVVCWRHFPCLQAEVPPKHLWLKWLKCLKWPKMA